jgi:hypothetical protein
MPDFSQSGQALLGRRGFFDQFSFVKFKDAEHQLDIARLKTNARESWSEGRREGMERLCIFGGEHHDMGH